MRMTGKKWQGLLCAGALTLATAAANAQYAGLVITEVILTPTENEMIEISNTSANPIDISGVIVTDEDNTNTEGACKFPMGTTIAPNEAIIVAVNNSTSQPTYLDTLPGSVRVFVEPSRSFAGWLPANGNIIAAMDEFAAAGGGTSNNIALANSADNAVLLQPSAVFANGVGPTDVTLTIDGANMGTSPWAPINPTGQLDTALTQGGVPGSGNSLQRTNSGTNTGTNAFFAVATADATTIGINPFAPVVGPDIIEDFTGFENDFGSILVGNTSASRTFTVSGDNLTDPVNVLTAGSGFEVATAPAGPYSSALLLPLTGTDVAGEPVTVYVRFNAAFQGFVSDNIDINSNGATSVLRPVTGAGYVDPLPAYGGLVVSEVVSQPSADEYVEIYNFSPSPIDISGVLITDEDNNNTEGGATFPAATSIAAGEVIMVAANNSATEPAWLDSLPANTRVFVEPARDPAYLAWTTINGITLTPLVEEFSALNEIAISGGDGIALFAPGTSLNAGFGPLPVTNCIDGMNYNNTDTGGRSVINNGGSPETQATRVGSAEPAIGQSYARIDTAINVNSSLRYQAQTQTPGVFGAPTDDPDAGAPTSVDFVAPFTGTVDVVIPVSNGGTTNNLNVTGASITGVDAAKFAVIGALPTGIAPASSGNITVRYTPSTLGGDTATIAITSNDTSGDILNVALNGFGVTNIDYANPVSIQLVVPEADIMAHTGQTSTSVDLRAIAIDDLGRLYTYTASKSSGTDADTTNPALVRIDVSGMTPTFTTIASRAELAAACNIVDATSMAWNGISVDGNGTVIYYSQFGGVDDVVKLVPGMPNTLTNMFEGDGIAYSVFDNDRNRLAVCRINDFGGPFGGSNFFSLDLTNLTGPWTEDIIATEAEIVTAGIPVGAGENGVVFAANMSDNSWLLWDEFFREGSDRILNLVEGAPPTITTAVEFDEVGPDPTGEGFESMIRDQNDTLFCWNEFPDAGGASPSSEGIFIFPAPINPASRVIISDTTINTALGLATNRDISAGGMVLRQVSATEQILYIADEGTDGIYAITFSVPAAGVEGDADGDTFINAADVTAIYNHINGIELLTGQNLINAATIAPADGTLDAADATALIDFIVDGIALP